MRPQWIDPARFRRILTRAIVLPLVVMAALAVGLVFQVNHLVKVSQESSRTDLVIAQMDVVRALLVDKEAALRGYLLTGRPSFLEPFRGSDERFGPAIAELRRLVAQEPDQLARLEAFEALWREWDQHARGLLTVRDMGGEYGSWNLQMQGQAMMQRARAQRSAIISAAEDRRQLEAAHARRVSQGVLLGGGGLALVIGGLLAAFVRKQLIEVSRNYEQAISLSELQAQALRHSEQQFRSIFDAAGDAMVIFDDAGTILDANPAASLLSGVPRETLIGRPLAAFSAEETPADPFGTIHTWAPLRGEWRIRRQGGEVRDLEYSATLHFLPGRHLSVLRDITTRKQQEEEIRQLNENLERRVKARTAELEQANRELESFSWSVSHDLRSPLRHISGFSDLLRRSAGANLDEESTRYLDTIGEAAKRASVLVDELLAFSRMQRAELRNREVDMTSLFEEVRRELEPELAGRKVEWSVSPLPKVRGDGSMLRLVVRNLLSNALKYTRQRELAKVEIAWTRREDELVFSIHDNGVGFDMTYA
ncbi:MAG: CHASE3 domain-containing protein, partial [Myxococcaceae bacterium]